MNPFPVAYGRVPILLKSVLRVTSSRKKPSGCKSDRAYASGRSAKTAKRQEAETETSKAPGSPIIILLPAAQLMTPEPICLRPQRVRAICDLSLSPPLAFSSGPTRRRASKAYNFYPRRGAYEWIPFARRRPQTLDTRRGAPCSPYPRQGSCQNE